MEKLVAVVKEPYKKAEVVNIDDDLNFTENRRRVYRRWRFAGYGRRLRVLQRRGVIDRTSTERISPAVERRIVRTARICRRGRRGRIRKPYPRTG